ncbi:MAG: hypothetical protein INR65_20760 [Gluconacetobacter diazotrophicus]|nr:hypothetical protein [Gluconacetobacter diazotrophicus]
MAFWSYIRGENQPSAVLVEVVETRLRSVLDPVIARIPVDEDYYLRHNPDVSEKVRSGELASARQHYLGAGYFEDRFPRAIPVDEPWYLSQYPDVKTAVLNGSFTSARQHFEQEGFKEGRLPSAGWSLLDTKVA